MHLTSLPTHSCWLKRAEKSTPPHIHEHDNESYLTCTAATSRAAWSCGPLQCSHLWYSGWRPVLQLRSSAHERRVNEVPGLMQRAPRVDHKAGQVLLCFQTHAAISERNWSGVLYIFEQLPQHVPLVWRSTACSRWPDSLSCLAMMFCCC